MHAAGRTRVVAETRSLAQVNEAIAEVLSGRITARLVFEFEPSVVTSELDAEAHHTQAHHAETLMR